MRNRDYVEVEDDDEEELRRRRERRERRERKKRDRELGGRQRSRRDQDRERERDRPNRRVVSGTYLERGTGRLEEKEAHEVKLRQRGGAGSVEFEDDARRRRKRWKISA